MWNIHKWIFKVVVPNFIWRKCNTEILIFRSSLNIFSNFIEFLHFLEIFWEFLQFIDMFSNWRRIFTIYLPKIIFNFSSNYRIIIYDIFFWKFRWFFTLKCTYFSCEIPSLWTYFSSVRKQRASANSSRSNPTSPSTAREQISIFGFLEILRNYQISKLLKMEIFIFFSIFEKYLNML